MRDKNLVTLSDSLCARREGVKFSLTFSSPLLSHLSSENLSRACATLIPEGEEKGLDSGLFCWPEFPGAARSVPAIDVTQNSHNATCLR